MIDRASALRAAVRRVVARTGVHGASMGAIASAASVATGTAYVHYSSKDELVLAAYSEAKSERTPAMPAQSTRRRVRGVVSNRSGPPPTTG